jgi:hypothetical protein
MDGRGKITVKQPITGAWRAAFSGLTLMGAIAGCNELQPMEVHSTYGPGVKISGLGPTYDWMPVKKGTEDHQFKNPEAHAFILNSIEGNLAAKGFEKKQDKPGFWVHYRVARNEKQDSSVSPHGVVYEDGSLILYVIDPQTKKTIWRGWARAKMNESDPPDVRTKRGNEAVRRIMEEFPAK